MNGGSIVKDWVVDRARVTSSEHLFSNEDQKGWNRHRDRFYQSFLCTFPDTRTGVVLMNVAAVRDSGHMTLRVD